MQRAHVNGEHNTREMSTDPWKGDFVQEFGVQNDTSKDPVLYRKDKSQMPGNGWGGERGLRKDWVASSLAGKGEQCKKQHLT